LLGSEDQTIEIREICWFDSNIDLIAEVLEALGMGLGGVLKSKRVGVNKVGRFEKVIFSDNGRGRVEEKGKE